LQKKFKDFIQPVIVSIFKKHNIESKLAINCPTFYFTDSTHYGEQIKNIDQNEDYTNEEKYTGMGKFITKKGKYFIVINSLVLQAFIDSGFKNIISKCIIFHEIGHWINEIITPEFRAKEKQKDSVSLRQGAEYLISIALDEFMTNSYINFLFSENECKELLSTDTLYDDLENIYSSVSDPFDLYTRFWNSPNAIFINTIGNIPFIQKGGGFRDVEILEQINIKSIVSLLSRPNINILLNHLIQTFNLVVSDYNSSNPSVLQKHIQ
jgi:hypothetical protein